MNDDLPRWAWSPGSTKITVDFRNMPREPRNPAAESATLGALMLSSHCVARLLPVLQPDHFTSRPHQDTFKAIEAIHDAGKPVDPLLVNDELRRQGRVSWGELKASVFIHACLEATYLPGHGTSYAALVLECAARRRILQAGVRIAQAAAHGAAEVPDLMRLMASEIQETISGSALHDRVMASSRSPIRLDECVAGVRQELTAKRGRLCTEPELSP